MFEVHNRFTSANLEGWKVLPVCRSWRWGAIHPTPFYPGSMGCSFGYVTSQVTDQATGAHFNLPGHTVANMKATVIEMVKKQSDVYRKERENFFIRKFNSYHAGLNKKM